jgi:hypothetical protein
MGSMNIRYAVDYCLSVTMQISHLFEVSPFLALSFLVCMGTVLWCIILLRRGCHHVADRFLIGFIGLLTIYQSVQILRRGGVLSIPHLRHFDEAVDLLVNSLYLIAALLLRMSTRDRFAAIFRLRLAEAEAAPHAHETAWQPHSGDPQALEKIRYAAPLLSPNALKLYVYICFHVDGLTGSLEVKEDELVRFLSNDRKALLAAFKELREKNMCDVELEQANKPVRITSAPVKGRPERAPAV